LEVLCESQPANPDVVPSISTAKPTHEQLLQVVVFVEEPIQISHVAENINAVLLRHNMKKTSGMALNKLLLANNFLTDASGDKLPTVQGVAAGISTTRRRAGGRDYDQCLFDANAQRLCTEIFFHEIKNT
jgi:hypothetical protein